MAYIYKITNDINQKVYIGKTEFSVEKRFKEHRESYKKERCEKRPLYAAMNKYGIEHFHVETIEETDNPEEREMYWIEHYDSFENGYNATMGGDGKKYIDYDLVVAKYEELQNAVEVAKQLNISKWSVRNILRSRGIEIVSSSEIIQKKYSKPVAKIDIKTGEILEIYPSYMEAERNNGNTRHIADVCNGKRKSCKGFYWKWV